MNILEEKNRRNSILNHIKDMEINMFEEQCVRNVDVNLLNRGSNNRKSNLRNEIRTKVIKGFVIKRKTI